MSHPIAPARSRALRPYRAGECGPHAELEPLQLVHERGQVAALGHRSNTAQPFTNATRYEQ